MLPRIWWTRLRRRGSSNWGSPFEHGLLAGALGGRGSNLHKDAFDRMLVAQAQSEGLTLITNDERIAAYDVPMLW